MDYQPPRIEWSLHAVQRLWQRSHKKLCPDDVEDELADLIGRPGCVSGEENYIKCGRLHYVLIWSSNDECWYVRTVLYTMEPRKVLKRRSKARIDLDEDMPGDCTRFRRGDRVRTKRMGKDAR